ncbi:lipid-A-disaccharide synthase [Paludibacter sp. 221]|uniref:lipid-A-disaccharide synthase n=1 Tax=Paludibacter sp. 221 TaxID=2302939 RepID=UPI0013D595F0|nr:lipid-A-disaccharide synthase [Paludibacter sp. 221]NDV47021.1 lipid-A-disaccharide synthase [Paludibacter sp. 221]
MKYFIIAGEASGDLHASNLMRELKRKDKNADFCFLGGDLMAAQGGEMVKHYRDMAYMGFIAVIKNASKIKDNMEACHRAILDFRPDVVILIDYPSFNLRIARFVKENLDIPVYYYISPKVWAWKKFRVRSIKRYIDRMFTILPFETEFYAKRHYTVEYVGNPSVDSVSKRPNQEQTEEEFWRLNNLAYKPIIALLPGSRKQEIESCLPAMLKSAEHFTDYQVVVSGAPGIEPEFYSSVLGGKAVNIVFGQTYELLQQASAAVVNSGTATLETALIGTPQVVVYHVAFGRLASFLKKIVIRVKYISLVNLIARKEVVKELVAHQFTAANVTFELELILRNENYRQTMLNNYSQIRKTLGKPGAAENAAKLIVKYLRVDKREGVKKKTGKK